MLPWVGFFLAALLKRVQPQGSAKFVAFETQATERRIGEGGVFNKGRDTSPINGYADQGASLYTGMDLKANF